MSSGRSASFKSKVASGSEIRAAPGVRVSPESTSSTIRTSQLVMSSHNYLVDLTILADMDIFTFECGPRFAHQFSGVIALIHGSLFSDRIQLI